MLNVGGGEVLFILVVALIVLGPAKLPEAVRQFGKALAQFRKLSASFQEEFVDVLDAPTEYEARAKGKAATEPAEGDPSSDETPDAAYNDTDDSGHTDEAEVGSPDETA